MKPTTLAIAAAAAILTSLAPVSAQDYPSQPIQIVVPYAPGGQGDITARLIAENLMPELGQSAVVENRPGANGTIGAASVAHAEPDGHTLLVVVQSHVLGKALMPSLSYDPVDSFAPISLIARTPVALVVSPTLPVDTLEEFVAYVAERPGELAFASAGIGSNVHIFAEWLLQVADLDMIHIPYSGSAAAHPDLMSGEVAMAIDSVPSVISMVRSGQLKMLALGGPDRLSEFPDVPTVAEAGYEDYRAGSWSVALAPAGTPSEIVEQLHVAITNILAREDVKERFAAMGSTLVASTPEEAVEIMSEENETFSQLIGELDISLE